MSLLPNNNNNNNKKKKKKKKKKIFFFRFKIKYEMMKQKFNWNLKCNELNADRFTHHLSLNEPIIC